MPLTALHSSAAAPPSVAFALLRWLVLISVFGLGACATAPPVAAVSPEPFVVAVAGAPAEWSTSPASTGPISLSPRGAESSEATAPVLVPLASAAVAEPVLEPVHATGADRSPSAGRVIARGTASWYGRRFHGRRTASGERFDMNGLTAAHRTLPFGTRVRVRSLATGREVVVRINDRGPRSRQRIIDLSLGAARALGVKGEGTIEVQLLRE